MGLLGVCDLFHVPQIHLLPSQAEAVRAVHMDLQFFRLSGGFSIIVPADMHCFIPGHSPCLPGRDILLRPFLTDRKIDAEGLCLRSDVHRLIGIHLNDSICNVKKGS